jgi:hypothetical protein
MAALDARARSTALTLLMKYGKSVSHVIVIEGTYDPITGEVSGGSTTTQIPKALIEDFAGTDYLSGLVEKGDKKITIPALGYTEPKPNDRFTVGSDNYTVIAVETVWSGDLAALYISQVRK